MHAHTHWAQPCSVMGRAQYYKCWLYRLMEEKSLTKSFTLQCLISWVPKPVLLNFQEVAQWCLVIPILFLEGSCLYLCWRLSAFHWRDSARILEILLVVIGCWWLCSHSLICKALMLLKASSDLGSSDPDIILPLNKWTETRLLALEKWNTWLC